MECLHAVATHTVAAQPYNMFSICEHYVVLWHSVAQNIEQDPCIRIGREDILVVPW